MNATIVQAIAAPALIDRSQVTPVQSVPSASSSPISFSQLLLGGLNKVNDDVQQANGIAHAFVLDDSIPVHQVTYALEQAHLSMELMLQVRTRLTEGLQQFMNMQL